jgi:hydrogenase nickel incorporation protein HypA/HybF
MHEFSAAQGIIETAIRFAQEKNAESVSKVRVEIGELTLLNKEQMLFAYSVATRGTILEGSELAIQGKKATFACHNCGEAGELPSGRMQQMVFHCPGCGGDIEITSGRQCLVKSMEIEP